MSRPVFLVIAGPNGAGKTTAAEPLLEVMRIEEYVNADVIAQGFSMLHAEAMAFTAGRLALQRIHTLIDEERSFAFETTLASRSVARLISRAKAGGF
jgi:predicted ABC-type ATPase